WCQCYLWIREHVWHAGVGAWVPRGLEVNAHINEAKVFYTNTWRISDALPSPPFSGICWGRGRKYVYFEKWGCSGYRKFYPSPNTRSTSWKYVCGWWRSR